MNKDGSRVENLANLSNLVEGDSYRGPSSIPSERFRVIGELGSGGMAEVYLAVTGGSHAVSKLVVVKALRAHLNEPEFREMFLSEARLAVRLNHSNVVQTYEVASIGGRDVIVMEYLDGQSLDTVRKKSKKIAFPIAAELHVISQILNGLDYSHNVSDFDGTPLGFVHRDISPQNVFITYDGSVKVLDFGISKSTTSTVETRTGVIKGKTRYMAPEQFAASQVTRRTDIYAAGVLLWEALTGKKMWSGLSDIEVMTKVCQGSTPPPSTVTAGIDPRLEEICMQALAFRPDDRFASAGAMIGALDEPLGRREMRFTQRALAQWMAEPFATERAERQQRVERAMSAIKASSDDASRPASTAITKLDESGPHATLHSAGTWRSPTHDDANATPRGTTVTDASLATTPVRKSWARLAGGLGLGLIIVLAVLAIKRGVVASVPVAKAAASEASAIASREPALVAHRMARISIHPSPSNARLFFDGESVSGDKLAIDVAADGSRHTVRAEAAGFLSRSISIVSDSDMDVDLALAKRPAEAPAVRHATPTPPRDSAEPSSSAKRKARGIDREDPW